jgi:sterol 3beta-glucosyltransferase
LADVSAINSSNKSIKSNFQINNRSKFMRILIIAMGSRGDIQPYIALGQGLKAAGHFVRLMSHENFEQLVSSYGLDFWPVAGDVQALLDTPEMRALVEKGDLFGINKHTAKAAERAAIDSATEGWEAGRGMDLLVGGIGGIFMGTALAEKLGISFLQAYLLPFTPTAAFPAVVFPQSLSRLGGMFNRCSHQLFRQIMWQGGRKANNLARQTMLDLPPAPFFGPFNSVSLQHTPVLYGFSPAAIAPPNDWQNTHVTGYWFLDEAPDWTPPPALVEFLANGELPIYIGFGSMTTSKPEELANLAIEALARTGQRGILQSGWGGLMKTDLPETILMVDSIPHSWLFPRMAAVVHHGGAGTTAAGLRAGVPSIVVPFFGDQLFWGQRVEKLGVGTAPIPRKKLTVEKLAQAIDRAVTDPIMRQRAAELGAKIQAEDGIANAVRVIESIEL